MIQLKHTHIAVLLERAPNNSKRPSSGWTDKQILWYIHTTEYDSAIKRLTCNNMDATQNNHAVWKRSNKAKCIFLNICNLLYFNYTSIKLLIIIKLGNFNDNWLHSTWRCYKTINYIKIGQSMMIHQMLETRNEKKNTAIEMNHEKG